MLDLDAIKQRVARATAGPWKSAWEHMPADEETLETVIYNEDQPNGSKAIVGLLYYDGHWAACTQPNSTFIAHARTDVPDLIAEVERLRALLGRYGIQDNPRGTHPGLGPDVLC